MADIEPYMIKTWYDDRSITESRFLAAQWLTEPTTGVICIIEYFESTDGGSVRGGEIFANHEWYWFDPATGRVATLPGYTVGTSSSGQIPAGVHIKRAPATLIPDGDYELMKDQAIATAWPSE